MRKPPLGEYLWTHVMVRTILSNQSYVRDVINFKTYSKSFKLKQRIENDKENWQIHKEVHEPIIDRELFEMVQKTFKTTKCQKPKHIEKNMSIQMHQSASAYIRRRLDSSRYQAAMKYIQAQ